MSRMNNLAGALAVILACMVASTAAAKDLTLEGHDSRITALAFSPDGTRLVSADESGAIKFWDAQTGKATGGFSGHDEAVRSLAVSPNGKGLVSAGADNAVKVWSMKSGENLRSFVPEAPELSFEDKMTGLRQNKAKGAGAAAFSGDTRFVASGHYDFTVVIWDLKTGAFKALGGDMDARMASKAHGQPVTAVAFSPDGKWVASGEETTSYRGVLDTEATLSGLLLVWNAQSATCNQSIQLKSGVLALAFLPDGKQLAAALANGSIGVWDAGKGKLIKSFTHGNGLLSMRLAQDGSRMVSLSAEMIKAWDLAGGGVKTMRPKLDANCSAIAISADGQRVAVGCEAGKIRILDVGTIQGTGIWDEGGAKAKDTPKKNAAQTKPMEDIWDDKPAAPAAPAKKQSE